MERMDTNLESCLEAYPNIPLQIKLSVLRDVSAGLLYLHSFAPPIIHGDLTTTNILLTPDWNAKIADFGNSVDESILSTAPGALAYMPPEASIKPLKYDYKLDIFSFGIVALYTGMQSKASYSENKEKQIRKLSDLPEMKSLHGIVTWCCEDDQGRRPTTMELNNHIQKLCPLNSHMKLKMEPNSEGVAEEIAHQHVPMDDRVSRIHEGDAGEGHISDDPFGSESESTHVASDRTNTHSRMEGLLGEQNAQIFHYKLLEGSHVSEIHRLHWELNESMLARQELERKCDTFQNRLDGLGTHVAHQQDPSLHVGGWELSEEVNQLSLQDQAVILRKQIAKLNEEKLKYQLAEAMEDHTSEGQLHVHKDVMRLQQENEGLKEQVEVLKMQLSTYLEDFNTERTDRTRAMENMEKLKKELDHTLQSQLTQHKAILADLERLIKTQTQKFVQMIEEAEEEVAVKESEVKQYQKQVENYKKQVDILTRREEVQKRTDHTTPALHPHPPHVVGQPAFDPSYTPRGHQSSPAYQSPTEQGSEVDDFPLYQSQPYAAHYGPQVYDNPQYQWGWQQSVNAQGFVNPQPGTSLPQIQWLVHNVVQAVNDPRFSQTSGVPHVIRYPAPRSNVDYRQSTPVVAHTSDVPAVNLQSKKN